MIFGLMFGLIALKVGVLLALAYIFKLEGSDRWLFGLGLAQASEFSFFMLSFTSMPNGAATIFGKLLVQV